MNVMTEKKIEEAVRGSIDRDVERSNQDARPEGRRVLRREAGHCSTSTSTCARTKSPRSSARPAAASPPFCACLNRMNGHHRTPTRVTGKITLDDEDIYDKNIDVVMEMPRAGRHRCVSEAEPVPEVDLRKRLRLRTAHPRLAKTKADFDRIVESSLQKAAIWNEVKSPQRARHHWSVRRQQQAPLHRARDRRVAPRSS